MSFFGRYLYNRNRMLGTPGAGGLNDNTRTASAILNDTHSVVGSYTHIVSSRTLNDFRFQDQTFAGGGQLLDNIGPGLTISGVGNFGRGLNQPQGRTQTRYQIIDNYTMQMDRHEIKIGADIHWVRIEASLPGTNAGPLGGLGGVFTFPSLAAFLDGNAVNFVQGFGTSGSTRAWWNTGLFVQDSFKPASNLTVNAGLRWEMQTMPEVVDVLNPNPHKLHQPMNNFGPRIGMSVQPRWRCQAGCPRWLWHLLRHDVRHDHGEPDAVQRRVGEDDHAHRRRRRGALPGSEPRLPAGSPAEHAAARRVGQRCLDEPLADT